MCKKKTKEKYLDYFNGEFKETDFIASKINIIK